MSTPRATHVKAILGLLLANLFWGLSFPLMKGIFFLHERLVPGSGSWFVTAMAVAPRFLLALAVLLFLARRQLAGIAPSEYRQGLLLGVAVSAGMLFQCDGLQFTSASVSAFLTLFYAITIPLVVAWRTRRAPPSLVWLCCALVLVGVAILARFDPRTMRLGRGELETLLSSFFFMWQIFTLEDRRYAANRVLPVTIVMFAVEAVVFGILVLATAPHLTDVLTPWASPAWIGFTVLLTGFCTLGAFTLMNRWQREITATEAGLIYSFEPVFTSIMALFLPALFSRWGGFDYANEEVTWRLLAGGGLITFANVLLQLKAVPVPASTG